MAGRDARPTENCPSQWGGRPVRRFGAGMWELLACGCAVDAQPQARSSFDLHQS